MKLLKAEMWDKMQYLFRAYYNRTMHASYFYDGTINLDALKKAYVAVINEHSNLLLTIKKQGEDFTLLDNTFSVVNL